METETAAGASAVVITTTEGDPPMDHRYDYAFKTRTVDDRRTWEELPITARAYGLTIAEARAQADRLAAGEDVVEIRYSPAGSLQGYYVPGPRANRIRHLRLTR
jgi:hypothetical protein